MTVFADDEARRHIIEATDGDMFVEAGAGTGKTTALVARIVGLLAAGRCTIDAVVAITFTEAAAGELRERLRYALELRRASGTKPERAHCQMALDGLESAAIQTIHGFAHRLLSRFSVDAGVPPSFEVQDRIAAKLLAEERWNMFLQRTLVSMDGLSLAEQDVIRVATALGLNQRHLKELTTALERHWYRIGPYASTPATLWTSIDVAPLLRAIDVVDAGFVNCVDDEDKLCVWKREALEPWVTQLHKAVNSSDPLAVIDCLGRAPSMKVKNKGAKGNWGGDVDSQRALIMALSDVRTGLLETPRQWAMSGVRGILCRYVMSEAESRRADGLISFDDLLVYALKLVQVQSVRQLLRQTYRYVFVDEFQDTDALQVEIVRALTDDRDEVPGAQLFTVGDPKQSIYRFRGADLTQFRSVRESTTANVTQLTTNFRTVGPVVQWVNDAFESLLSLAADEWTSLGASRHDAATGGVRMLGDAVEGLRARDVRESEAADVVASLVEAKQEGWLIEDGNETRNIGYGDMALLMPTRRSLPAIERELRKAKVPYRIESRSLIWATQEIRDLTATLRAISNPRDEVAVVAALRSAAFGCGDDDLYQWRTNGGTWCYSDEMPEASVLTPVGRALARLRALNERHRWVPVSQFVSEVVSDLQMYELGFARPRQREAWHRLRFAVDRARAWTEEGGSGLHGFVQWIETQDKEAADAIETVVPEADDDAVRVLTIHASKGLEFPLVGIVGIGSRETVTNSARILWTGDECELRIGSKEIAWETPGFEAAAQLDTSLEDDEQLRLLYVAVTRARDHLVVSLYRQATRGRASLAAQLHEVLGGIESAQPPARTPVNPANEQRTFPLADESPENRRLRRASLIKTASRQLSLSATAIATKSAGIDGVLPSFAAGSSDLEANELAERLAFGSAVHSVLEVIELDASDELISLAVRPKATEFALEHRVADMERSVSSALSSHHVRRALTGGRWWREVPVYSSSGEMVVGGTIDLLYEVDGELVIADYKTEEVKDDAATQHAIERYKWQLATYALVCERTTGKKVREAVLLFIPPSRDGAQSVNVQPLDQLTERLTNEVLPLLT